MLRLLLNTSLVKFISLLGALVFSWLISLMLPVSDAGRLFAVLAITPGIAVFLGFGINQTVLRLGSKRFAERGFAGLIEVMRYAARSILKRTAILTLISTAAALGGWYLLPQQTDAIVKWLLALVVAPFFAALTPAAMGFRVQSRYARSILSEPSAVMTFAAIGFVLLGLVSEPQFWLAFGAYGVALVVLSFPLFRVVYTPRGDPVDHDHHFGITQIAQYFLQWGVVGQISFYATNAEIAAISLSMRTVMLINMILILVNTVNANRISEFLQTGQDEALRKLLRQQSPILVTIGLTAAIVLWVCAPYAYGVLGSEFDKATQLTRLLVLGQLVNVYVGPANLMLNMSGHARVVSRITISVGLSVTLLVWPFYTFGGIAAIALLISLSLATTSILAAFSATRATGIRPIWPPVK